MFGTFKLGSEVGGRPFILFAITWYYLIAAPLYLLTAAIVLYRYYFDLFQNYDLEGEMVWLAQSIAMDALSAIIIMAYIFSGVLLLKLKKMSGKVLAFALIASIITLIWEPFLVEGEALEEYKIALPADIITLLFHGSILAYVFHCIKSGILK